MAVVTALAAADAFSDPEQPAAGPHRRAGLLEHQPGHQKPIHYTWRCRRSPRRAPPQQFIKTGQLMIGWADNQRRVNCKVRHGILSAEISCHVFHLS